MHAKAALALLVLAVSATVGPAAHAQSAAVLPAAVAPVAAASGTASGTSAATTPTARRTAATLASVVEAAESREPNVQHNVFEDGGSKVDELVVRGEVQHVVVTPKVGTGKSYEIIVQRGGRTPPDSTGGATSAVGKRVWNVLAF